MNRAWRTVALIAGILASLAITTPAQADVQPASCNSGERYLNAWVYVTEVGPHHHWEQFRYQLGGASTGGKSNVNFWVLEYNDTYSNAVTAYWNHSEDNLRTGPLYTVVPPWAVYTWGPTNERTELQATFDIFGPDPQCDAATVPV